MIFSLLLSTICLCGEAPERANDFFWENDRVGFRAYGPGDVHKWSGIDVFNKSVSTNIVVHWLREPGRHGNWHLNHGQGMDDYAVGPGRGVGGVALRKDGKWLPDYGNWVAYRVITNSDERCAFELDYKLPIGGTMTLGIALKRGSSLFAETVTLSKEVPTEGLEVGVGLDLSAERLHVGDLFVDEKRRLVSLFEEPHTIKDNKRTTTREGGEPIKGEDGSMMSALYEIAPIKGSRLVDGPESSKMVLTYPLKAWDHGTVLCIAAGADWTEAGRFKTAKAWHRYVREDQKKTWAKLVESLTGQKGGQEK